MSADSARFAAVDLGAGSGRVILGEVAQGQLNMEVLCRFPNDPITLGAGLHTDIVGLYSHVLDGLASAVKMGAASIGVDSWGVDYALFAGNRMLGVPFHYRDARTSGGVQSVHDSVNAVELYRANGLQHLPFNTVFQLATEGDLLGAASQFLLIPDIINFWLSGVAVSERTNASTTGLLSPATREWDRDIARRAGIPERILPRLVDPGTSIGPVSRSVSGVIGGSPKVIAVASHDTASAVVGVPATVDEFAYISCGTWGLVGVETDRPIITDEARIANFTNEGGLDGTTRFLRNVMGLWLLDECLRHWRHDGVVLRLEDVLAAAAKLPAGGPVFDVDDPVFMPPGAMPDRIRSWLRDRDMTVPDSIPALVRCILESLAIRFAETVQSASELSGSEVKIVHLVGGGSRNALLCQLTADRIGLPVVAGPEEATAIGNVLVQARASGMVASLGSMRALVAQSSDLRTYAPQS